MKTEFDKRYGNKMTFWEWAAKDIDCSVAGTAEYVHEVLFEGKQIHLGDCTKHPCSCGLCSLETLLSEYRKYYFEEDCSDCQLDNCDNRKYNCQ